MLAYLEELMSFMESLTQYEYWMIEEAIEYVDYGRESIRIQLIKDYVTLEKNNI